MNEFFIDSPDGKWHADISACLGANVTRLQYNGKDIFRPLESTEQLKIDPYLQGSPILFPANRTYKGEFCFEGEKYFLPINEPATNSHLHGRLHYQKFELLQKSSTQIKLSYENKGEIYPFPFVITVEYCLTNDFFRQKYWIENTGKKNMPLTFALHTTFIEPDNFYVPIDARQEKDQCGVSIGRYASLNEQEQRYSINSESKGIRIADYYRLSGNTARVGEYQYRVSDNFDHWILYNAGGASGFLCVEPQCGAVNGLNIADGHKIIEPGYQEVFYTSISKIL